MTHHYYHDCNLFVDDQKNFSKEASRTEENLSNQTGELTSVKQLLDLLHRLVIGNFHVVPQTFEDFPCIASIHICSLARTHSFQREITNEV